MEGDLTWVGEHTLQYTDDVIQNCITETYTILLTNVAQKTSIKDKIKSKKYFQVFLNEKFGENNNFIITIRLSLSNLSQKNGNLCSHTNCTEIIQKEEKQKRTKPQKTTGSKADVLQQVDIKQFNKLWYMTPWNTSQQ